VRRSRLIDNTLKPLNATIQVKLEVNGVPHVVRRNAQDGALQIKVANDEMRPCTEEEVRSLLPVQAYSQKQLSDVSVRPEELARFITAPIRADLAQIERLQADRAARIRQSYTTWVRQRTLLRTLQKRELAEKSLSEQASTVRASIIGLSEEDQAVLDRGKLFETADRSVQSWHDGVKTFQEGAEALRQTVDAYSTQIGQSPTDTEGAILKAAYEQYRTLLGDAKSSLDSLIAQAAAIQARTETMSPDNPWRQWADKIAIVRTDYEAAVQRSSAQSEKMKQLKDIEEQLTKHARESARVSDEARALATAETNYRTERDAWEYQLKERDDLLDKQCAVLTENSGGAIRAMVKRFADAADFVNTLRQSLSGTRFPGAKVDALGQFITSGGDPIAGWRDLLTDLAKLAEFDVEQDGADRRPETPTLSAAGLTNADLDRLGRSFKPEHWLALSLISIKSVPVFEYRAREADYIPFSSASVGQQATALLKTLLNQAGPPLIIDQPEEDLDNPVMLEIVELVWQAKQKRQLIFASHNANLVVNGDAELVAWCDYRIAGDQSRGTIAGEGAIDVGDVREAIKGIMEGGEAAFNLRREKYGF